VTFVLPTPGVSPRQSPKPNFGNCSGRTCYRLNDLSVTQQTASVKPLDGNTNLHDRQAGRQTDRQTDRQTGADRERGQNVLPVSQQTASVKPLEGNFNLDTTDRQTDRQTERQTYVLTLSSLDYGKQICPEI